MKHSTQQLEEILRAAHGQRPLPEADADWNQQVMQAIRRQAIDRADLPTVAGPLVWRFAAASCCVALALFCYVLGAVDGEQLALDLFIGDPLLGQSMRLLSLASGL